MRILVADDDPVSRQALEALLANWGYDVTTVADGESACGILEDVAAPRLAILDWTMPGLDGAEVCRALRCHAREPYIYILLTAPDAQLDVVRGLEAGVDDYLTKPFDPQELKARLRAGRRALALLDSLLSARDALRYQSAEDPLTGLVSRPEALSCLSREIARSARRGSPLAVALSDLDEFELLNRTYGYPAGDAVLSEAARRIRSSTRPHDVVRRYGTHRFIIVLSDCDQGSARKYAQRFHQTIHGPFTDFVEERLRLTASVGLATADGSRFQNGDTSQQAGSLVRAADAALR
jgi:diguanylate cyclase (GGDEF)-like protein